MSYANILINTAMNINVLIYYNIIDIDINLSIFINLIFLKLFHFYV